MTITQKTPVPLVGTGIRKPIQNIVGNVSQNIACPAWGTRNGKAKKGGKGMIYLYSGTPGSGKSLHTSRVIYWTLKRGYPVLANFPVNTGNIRKAKGEFVEVANDTLTPKYLINYARGYFQGRRVVEGKILLILDECQLMFNAREWNTKGRNEWLSFFTQHRKFGYDVILVAQFDRMIDRQIRALIEYEQIHRKVSNFGIKGKVLSAFCLGNLFVSVKVWYPMKEKVGSEFFIAHKKYYSLYDTFGMFAPATAGIKGSPQGEGADMTDEKASG